MNIYRKLLLILVCTLSMGAAAQTTSLGFKKPVVGTTNWGSDMNSNFTLLNSYLTGSLVLPSLQVNALSGNYMIPASKLSGIINVAQLPTIPWSKLTNIPSAFPPFVHGAIAHDSTVEATSHKGQAFGYAGLDSTGKVPTSQLPPGSGGGFAGPNSSTANNLMAFNDTTGAVGKDSGVAVSTDTTFAANSDAKLPTEKAIKVYAAPFNRPSLAKLNGNTIFPTNNIQALACAGVSSVALTIGDPGISYPDGWNATVFNGASSNCTITSPSAVFYCADTLTCPGTNVLTLTPNMSVIIRSHVGVGYEVTPSATSSSIYKTGTPSSGQQAVWTDALHIQGQSKAVHDVRDSPGASIVEKIKASAAGAGKVFVPEGSYTASAISTWTSDFQGYEDNTHKVGAVLPSGTWVQGAGIDKTVITVTRTSCADNGSLFANVHRASPLDDTIRVSDMTVIVNDATTGCPTSQMSAFEFLMPKNIEVDHVKVMSATASSPNRFFNFLDVDGLKFHDNECYKQPGIGTPRYGYGDSCVSIAEFSLSSANMAGSRLWHNKYVVSGEGENGNSNIAITSDHVTISDEDHDGCSQRSVHVNYGNAYEVGSSNLGIYSHDFHLINPHVCGLQIYPIFMADGSITHPMLSVPFTPHGVVNTSGTAVTFVAGMKFSTGWTGAILAINGSNYTVSSCASTTACTLSGSAGTQTSVVYSMLRPNLGLTITAAGGGVPNSGSVDVIGGEFHNANLSCSGATGDTAYRDCNLKNNHIYDGAIGAQGVGSRCSMTDNFIKDSTEVGLTNAAGCYEERNEIINAGTSVPGAGVGLVVTSVVAPLVDDEKIIDEQASYLTGSNGTICNIPDVSPFQVNTRTCTSTPSKWIMLEDQTKVWIQNWTNRCVYVPAGSSNCFHIKAFSGVGGKINTHGTVNIEWVSGDKFDTSWPSGLHIMIYGEEDVISSVTDSTHIVLSSATGWNSSAIPFAVSGRTLKSWLAELEEDVIFPTGTTYDLKPSQQFPVEVVSGVTVFTHNKAFGVTRNFYCAGGSPGQTFGTWGDNYFNGQTNCAGSTTPAYFDVRDTLFKQATDVVYGFRIDHAAPAGHLPCSDSGSPGYYVDCAQAPDAAKLNGATFASPGAIGATTPAAGTFSFLKITATGAGIIGHLSATASLNFAAWAGNDCQTLTIPVTGAADGDSTEVGIPNTLASVADVVWSHPWVSSGNTVSLRGCKVTAGASSDPAAVTVRADVWQH